MNDTIPFTAGQQVPTEATIVAALKLAETLCQTSFVPDSFRGKAGETLAAILYGAELGIGPMTALQQIAVIKGRPSASPELMRALIRRAGHSIEVVEHTNESCTLRGTRGDDATTELSSFTMEDARRANLLNGGAWKTYPKAMLLARASSQLGRSLFADVISGISYTPEELNSIDAPSPSLVAIHHDPQPAELPSGLISAREAVKELVTACGGVVEDAKALWGPRGGSPISRAELDELLMLTDADDAIDADVLLGLDAEGEAL